MKNLLFIILLLPAYMTGQTLYTTYDCDTHRLLESSMIEPTDPEVCYTTVPTVTNICEPAFDEVNQVWYSSCTLEEQELYPLTLELQTILCTQINAVINNFTAPLSNEQLNTYFPCQNSRFTVYCPNVKYGSFEGTGTVYVKTSTSLWWSYPMYKN